MAGGRGGRAVRLTGGELAEFYADYVDLLTWYAHRHTVPPPGARQVALRFYALPSKELADGRPAIVPLENPAPE